MSFVHKFINNKCKSEKGFVFIVALIAIIVLTAIGYFALTMISEDLMISSRMVGERKAFSAAEAGAHAVFASINLKDNPFASNTNAPVKIDPVNDPAMSYVAEIINTERQTVFSGEDLSSAATIFEAHVTGRDSDYDSEVRLSIGMAPPPTAADTQQGKL
jgi:uncharacterized protein (UPF0333 family)